MISVGIIGGSGYTGKKLIQYCTQHQHINELKIYGFSSSGESLLTLFPDLTGIIADDKITPIDKISYEHDVYFIALPYGEALKFIPGLIMKEKIVVDLGGDYRLNDQDEYLKWYKITHNSPELMDKKIYGLADVQETDYSVNSLIANPGCYPTAASLSLIPLVQNFSKSIITISTSAYSGTSGAGKSPKQELLMSEMDGNVNAYNLNNHRHYPEILQILKQYGFDSSFAFATHLLPVSTGIYSTSFIHLYKKIKEAEIKELYSSFYKNSFFIRLRNEPPKLSWVVNTNFCDINISSKENTIIITSAIDNLIKGAAGQAVQNMNRFFGWEESLGILSTHVKSNPERVRVNITL